MNIELEKSILSGEVIVPPSKSITHRAIICAAIAEIMTGEKSQIINLLESDDITATLNAMSKMSNVKEGNNKEIFCNESGSTLRFMLPIAAAFGGEYTFTGAGRLVSRPIDAFIDILNKQGIPNELNRGQLPFSMKGKLSSGIFKIAGNVSSQYISGLMFALPILQGESIIEITGEIESKPYIDLTIDVLRNFGIIIDEVGRNIYNIAGGQKYKAARFSVEGDYSQAAFWQVAKGLGMNIEIKGLNSVSKQGDREILRIVNDLKSDDGDDYIVDVSQIPDLVPAIAVMAALSRKNVKITNAARLRIKESDRLKAVSDLIGKIGGDIEELSEGLVIKGKLSSTKDEYPELEGGCSVSSYNDHRIAMAAGIAALWCRKPIIIEDAGCVKKSYPDFWEVYRGLGGIAREM